MPTYKNTHLFGEWGDLVIPTGLGWNTLHESIVELDRKLEELGLEVKSNE